MKEADSQPNQSAISTVVREDESGEATRAIIDSLRDAAEPINAALRGTLSQNEYHLCEDLQRAMQIAEKVVKAAWEKAHPNRSMMY